MSLSYTELLGIHGEAIEFEWNISQDFHRCRFFNRFSKICEEPERFTDRTISMSSMFNDIDWTRKEMMEFVFRIRKKSRNTGRNSRKDTERFWVLDTTRTGMELFLTHLKKWDSTATQMVERFKDTGHPIFKRKSTQIVKVLDTYGLEIAIPSPNDSTRTSHVMISRGKSPFVDELHIPNVEHGTSAELLSEQKAKESEPCLAQSKTGIQGTGAAYVTSQTSIQETGADTPSISSQPSVLLSTKNHSYDREEVECCSCQVIVLRSPANSGLPKMVTRLVRHHDQDERQSDAEIHWDTTRAVLRKAFAKQGPRDFSDKDWRPLVHQGCSKMRFWYCENSKIPWLSSEQFKDTLVG